MVPVFNSAATLPELHRRLGEVFRGLGGEYELVFVDDGSADDSWAILEKLAAADPRLRAIQLARNFGQHNALLCGLARARGQFIVTLDDDLQNPPEEIPRLAAKIAEGHDLVYGEYKTKQHGFFRNLGSRLVRLVFRRVSGVRCGPTAFRCLTRELARAAQTYDKNFVFLDGLFAWNTARIAAVPVEHHPRAAGRSGYGPVKLVGLALNLLTNFSLGPLRLASILGFLFALTGFGLGLFFLAKKIFWDIPFPGFASTFVALSLFAGAQLITLGLIGEYLGRVHHNLNAKPQYRVRREAGGGSEAPEAGVRQ